MIPLKTLAIVACCLFLRLPSFSQNNTNYANCERPATVIIFRTFSPISILFHYNLYAADSLLGRIKTNDVFILETFDEKTSFHATTRAPSLNADQKSGYQKRKTIKYPFSLQTNHVYFVKCGFLNQNLFDYPRQPTIRLVKKNELSKYLKKKFIKKKIKNYLYNDWLTGNNVSG